MDTDAQGLETNLTEAVMGSAFEVSKALGAGFLEKVYERAMLPGRPGLASSKSSLTKTFSAGSGAWTSIWLTSAATVMPSVCCASRTNCNCTVKAAPLATGVVWLASAKPGADPTSLYSPGGRE